MVRAAAKNHRASPSSSHLSATTRQWRPLLVVVSPLAQRRELAVEAFRHTAGCDVAVASWLGSVVADDEAESPLPAGWPGMGSAPRCCATARIRTNAPRCMSMRSARAGSPGRNRCTERRCPATTSSMPMPRTGAPTTSTGRLWQSSSTPTLWHRRRRRHRGRPSQGQRHRPGLRLRRVIAANRTVSAEMARQVAEVFTEVIVAPATRMRRLDPVGQAQHPNPDRRGTAGGSEVGVAADLRRPARAGDRSDRRRRRRPGQLDPILRRARRRSHLGRPRLRLAGLPGGQEQRHSVGSRRRRRRDRYGSGEPGRFGQAGGGTRR